MARKVSLASRPKGARYPTASKAQEMLDNPPKNQPGTKKQKGFFRALAYGFKPTKGKYAGKRRK